MTESKVALASASVRKLSTRDENESGLKATRLCLALFAISTVMANYWEGETLTSKVIFLYYYCTIPEFPEAKSHLESRLLVKETDDNIRNI
jgi:hypothetical protein